MTLLYSFSWNVISFGRKEPIKVQNFRLLLAHLKFHQILTLIGSFYWRYIKFWLKKYRGVMSHDTEEWYKIWRKIDLLFQKWQEFGEFWRKHLKVSRICTLIGSFCAKKSYFTWSYLTWGVTLHGTKGWCKIWKKIYLWFGKWQEEFGNFSPEHLKVSKLGLWSDPFIQSRKYMSLNFKEGSFTL